MSQETVIWVPVKKQSASHNWHAESSDLNSVNSEKIVKKKKLTKRINTKSLVQYINLPYMVQHPNTTLQVTCSTKQFYNIQLKSINNEVIRLEIPQQSQPSADDLLNIDTMQLLNWPGICTTLQLGDVTLRRQIVPNYRRGIVVGPDTELDRSTNRTDYHRLNAHSSGAELSVLMLDTLLQVHVNALAEGGLLQARIRELRCIFKLLKEDLDPFEQIYKHVTYSRYMANNQFVREFVQKTKDEQNIGAVRLRETINPELQLTIVDCPYTVGCDEDKWSNAVYDEFVKVFDGNLASLAALNTKFKTCLTFDCMECVGTEPMSGVFSVYAAKQHMALHYQETPHWKCSKCNTQVSQEQLASLRWCHVCDSK